MPPERNRPDEGENAAIDRFWDQIAQGRSGPTGDLDPADAATIRHLHAGDDRPHPERDFARRLREDLMDAYNQTLGAAPGVAPRFSPNGFRAVAGPREWTPPRGQGRWSAGLSYAAFATLLLAILTLGYLAFGDRLFDADSRTAAPIVAPEVSPSPAATPEPVKSRAIIEVVLPAEMVPGDPVAVSLTRRTFASTGRVDYPALSPRALVVEWPLSGTVRVEGPALALRVAARGPVATVEAIAPGTNVYGAGGDPIEALVIGGTGAATVGIGGAGFVIHIEMIGAGDVAATPVPVNAAGMEDALLDTLSATALAALPPGPLLFRLDRVTVPPGAVLPPPEPGTVRLAGVDTGEIDRRAGGAIGNAGEGALSIYVVTLSPVPASGTPTS